MDADKVAMFCGDSYQCKYDYSITLNKEFAQFTKYYQDQFVNIYEGVLKPDAMVTNSKSMLATLYIFLLGCLVWPTSHAWEWKKVNLCIHSRHNGQV